MNESLRVAEADGIMEVVLNRPEKHNAISDEMLERLRGAVHRFGDNRSLRVLLIRATGRYFTSGMEVSADFVPHEDKSSLDARYWYRNKLHSLFDELESVEKPVVAAHQGPCLGGGLEMSLSCDFRLAANGAYYALPEIDIGVLPGSGGVSRLTRIAGPHWARWMVMAGERVDAHQALAIGLVHAVYPDEQFEARTNAFCVKLAKQPYEVLGLAKLSIELAMDLDRTQARNVERISNTLLFAGLEHRELLQAFLDRQASKRKARTTTDNEGAG